MFLRRKLNWRCCLNSRPSPGRAHPLGLGRGSPSSDRRGRIAAVLAAFVFPLFAHWAWGGGWLAQLGVNFSLGAGFLDPGGAASIHVLGGLSALAVIWIAGSRKGKFPKEGFSTAMPGHNAVYVLFGCLLALVGWLASTPPARFSGSMRRLPRLRSPRSIRCSRPPRLLQPPSP